jgi:hypothetical protein
MNKIQPPVNNSRNRYNVAYPHTEEEVYDIFRNIFHDEITCTFDGPINLSNNVMHSGFPDIFAEGNNVYVVWDENNDIYFMKSSDYGSTFDSFRKLDRFSI